jgi:hypothetical protein
MQFEITRTRLPSLCDERRYHRDDRSPAIQRGADEMLNNAIQHVAKECGRRDVERGFACK